MILGKEQPVVAIYNYPAGVLVETMILPHPQSREYLSEKIVARVDSKYSQTVKTIVRGYRFRERLAYETYTYNDTLENWTTIQDDVATEWGFHKIIRLLDYYRQKFLIEYWSHKEWFDRGLSGEMVKIVDTSNAYKGIRVDTLAVDLIGINTRRFHFLDLDAF